MQFQYRAVDPRGERREGALEAPSREAALARLHGQGLVVWKLASSTSEEPELRLGGRDRARFFLQLSVMLESGLGLVRGLGVLARVEPPVGPVAACLQASIERGQRFSVAMGQLPECFTPTWVGLVRVGEETGALTQIMRRLAEHLELTEVRRGRLLSALIYPLCTLLGALGVSALMVFWMVPRFVGLVEPGGELPGPTRLLLWISQPTVFWGLVWLSLVGLGLAYLQRQRLLSWLWNAPLLGRWLKLGATAELCRSLALMLDAGLPLAQGLRLLRLGPQSTFLEAILRRLEERLRQGEELKVVFQGSGLSPFLVQLASIGAELGRLPPMLDQCARLLEEEAEGRLDSLMVLLEPMLVGFCGLVVGFVLMAAFLPAYGLLLEVGL